MKTVATNYKNKALHYAEQYGIIDYKVIKNTMVYRVSYPLELNTYRCVVNLDTMEEKRNQLKRYYKN